MDSETADKPSGLRAPKITTAKENGSTVRLTHQNRRTPVVEIFVTISALIMDANDMTELSEIAS